MFVVAITEILGSHDDAAARLADVIGKTEVELRVLLRGTLPRIVFRAASREAANAVQKAIQRDGHGAVTVGTDEVIGAPKIALHRFAFDETALYATDRAGSRLPWADVAAIIVVLVRTDVLRTMTYAVASTVGIKRHADVTVEHTAREQLGAHFAYLVPRARADAPECVWVLSENDSKYLALGPLLRPTRRQNFRAMVSLMVARAPHAVFDDRFSVSPLAGDRLLAVGANESAVAPGIDLGVEMSVVCLARWLLRGDSEGSAKSET